MLHGCNTADLFFYCRFNLQTTEEDTSQPAMTPLSPEKHQDQPQYHGKESIGMDQGLPGKTEQTVIPSSPECVREVQATTTEEAALDLRRRQPLMSTQEKQEKQSDTPGAHRGDDQAAPKANNPRISPSEALGGLMEDSCVVDDGARADDAAEPVTEVSELANLMLGPGGLRLKKVTPEGFAIPISLRLLAPRSSALLSLTWLDGDEHGFDLGMLTAIEVLDSSKQKSLMWNDVNRARHLRLSTQARKRGASDIHHTLSSGGCRNGADSRIWWRRVRFGCPSNFLLLRWESLDAELVIEAGSQQQSDLLYRCLEQLATEAQFAEGQPKLSSMNSATSGWRTLRGGDDDKDKEKGRAMNSPDHGSHAIKQPGNLSWTGTGSFRGVDGIRKTDWVRGGARSETGVDNRGLTDLEQHRNVVAELTSRLLAAYDKAKDESREAAWHVGVRPPNYNLYDVTLVTIPSVTIRFCLQERRTGDVPIF